jgi:hypothetical protein
LTILFFTLVVFMLGFGMIIPILPFYIDDLGASGSDLGLLMANLPWRSSSLHPSGASSPTATGARSY